MKSLLVHLKDYKKESVLAQLFKDAEASFELFKAAGYGSRSMWESHRKTDLYCKDVFCVDRTGNHRAGLLYHSTVFLRQRQPLWICDRCAACII